MIPAPHQPSAEAKAISSGGNVIAPGGAANAATLAAGNETGGRAAHSNFQGRPSDEEIEEKGKEAAEGGKRANVGLRGDQSGITGGGGGQK
ncbi:hypothetical protein P7C70_g8427, partial [Phenoliferia sp. Uapishka_3]